MKELYRNTHYAWLIQLLEEVVINSEYTSLSKHPLSGGFNNYSGYGNTNITFNYDILAKHNELEEIVYNYEYMINNPDLIKYVAGEESCFTVMKRFKGKDKIAKRFKGGLDYVEQVLTKYENANGIISNISFTPLEQSFLNRYTDIWLETFKEEEEITVLDSLRYVDGMITKVIFKDQFDKINYPKALVKVLNVFGIESVFENYKV